MNEQMIAVAAPNKSFVAEVKGTQHTFYLTGPIGAPDEYVELCNTLRTASPQDEVVIRINSRGGFVSSERMIVNAINESQATVKGFIEYDCMSAATGIFLACHQHAWAQHIQFMAHCSWWGSIGKNPDIKSQTEFGIQQMEEEIVTTYSGMFNEEEIRQLNEGKEFWLGSKELEQRMIAYYEYQDSQVGENFSEGDLNEINLEEMIDSAVESGLKRTMDKLLEEYLLVKKESAVMAAPKPKPARKKVAPKSAFTEKELEGSV